MIGVKRIFSYEATIPILITVLLFTLSAYPWVERAHNVGFNDCPRSDLSDAPRPRTSSILSFEPRDQDPAKLRVFTEALEIFQLGVSWGGFESLAVPLEISPMGSFRFQRPTSFLLLPLCL